MSKQSLACAHRSSSKHSGVTWQCPAKQGNTWWCGYKKEAREYLQRLGLQPVLPASWSSKGMACSILVVPQVFSTILWGKTNKLDSDSTYASNCSLWRSETMQHPACSSSWSSWLRLRLRRPLPVVGKKSTSKRFSEPSKTGVGQVSATGEVISVVYGG